MSDEGNKDSVGKTEVEDIKPDADGKYPETVPWSKYVGIKESLGSKLDAERERVKSLEEKLKNAPNVEEHTKLKEELESTKTKLQEKEGKLTEIQEKSVSELRSALTAKGVPEERVSKMSETEMKTALEFIGDRKPLPDLGGGGGKSVPIGTPLQLARDAYAASSKK